MSLRSWDFVLWRLSRGLVKTIKRAKMSATPNVIRKAISIDIKLTGFSSFYKKKRCKGRKIQDGFVMDGLLEATRAMS